MRKIVIFINFIISVGILIVGIIVGFYYHNELMVIWSAHQASPTPILIMEPEIPASVEEQKTVIKLPGLENPLPIIYSETLDEEIIQQHLKQGAVLLPLGTAIGNPGNVVITAHSSGSESFGPYRFAFSKLSELEEGDEYSIETAQALYTYKVYAKEIVWPHQVDKLPKDDRSTVTLVTCWPLWTNFQRLLVHTELIKTDYHI